MLEEKYYKQLRTLKKEIKSLKFRLEKIPKGIVTDFAYDYSSGFPRSINLAGQADPVPLERTIKKLNERINKHQLLEFQLEREISEIEDANTRYVLEHYYILGETFLKIASDLEFSDECSVRRIKNKYFRKKSKVAEKADF